MSQETDVPDPKHPPRWNIPLTVGLSLGAVGLAALPFAVAIVVGSEGWGAFAAFAFLGLAIVLLILATPFLLAGLLPPGKMRRLIVGLAVSLLSGAVVLLLASSILGTDQSGDVAPAAYAAAALAFVLAFYFSYRLSR